jgi:hypothetical protein
MPVAPRTWSRRLGWLALLFAVLGLAHLAVPSWWAEAYGPPAPARPGSETAAQDRCASVPGAGDPWARSPTGSPLDTGYGPGEERPRLLP